MSSTMSHEDICDKLFEVRGIDSVCAMLTKMPEEIRQYREAGKKYGMG